MIGSLGYRSYSGAMRRHRHDHHQIVLPHRGRLELEVEDRRGAVAGGMGAFIAAGASHAFLAEGSNAFLVLDLPRDEGDLAGPGAAAAFFAVTPALQALLDYLTALPADEAAPTLREAWSALLLDGIARSRRTAADPAALALDRAQDYMRRHLATPLRVAEIAAAAGVSPTRLHALFRERAGKTPHAALTELRLQAAQRLLAATPLSIAEVALRTGHADQSALTRRLRLACGITPAAFRRACRGGG